MIIIPLHFSDPFKCELCHYCTGSVIPSYGHVCNHPLGAALKRYPDKEVGFNIGIICKNWQEDYPIKIPASFRKSLSTKD